VAQRIDAGYAAQESASLPDPEIEAVADVARAGVMLEQEPTMTLIAVWQKGEHTLNIGFDIPWWSTGSSAKSGGGAEKAQAQ
jgi:hypothetical protein